MRYGIQTIEDFRPSSHGTSAEFLGNLIERAVLAEELGYEGFWLAEHHFHWYGSTHCNPAVVLAAIAARTERLRLGTAVTLLPLSHPLRIAEDFSLLDNISGGRVDLGVGRGFFKVEYDGWGVSMGESRQRFAEALEVINRVWTEDTVTHHGEHYDFEDLELVPRPVQQPRPPIWIAGSITPETFVNNGRLGLPLMVVPTIAGPDGMKANVQLYLEAYEEAGHTDPPQVLAFFMTHITEESEAFEQDMHDAIMLYRSVSETPEQKMRGERDATQYAHFAGLHENMQYFTFENMQKGDQILCGTPEHCAEVLERWRDEVGMTYACVMPSWGGFTEEQVQTTMRRFMGEVVPLLEGSSSAGAAHRR